MFKEQDTETIIKTIYELEETNKKSSNEIKITQKKVNLQELENNLIKFLNDNIGRLYEYKSEIELLKELIK